MSLGSVTCDSITHSRIHYFFSYFPVSTVTAANIADMWHFSNMAFDSL